VHEVDSILLFTRPLDVAGINYMVAGAVASIVYGEPRLTNDVDLVVYLDDRAVRNMETVYPATNFYCPPLEVMLAESRRAQRGHFNIIHHQTGYKADIYMPGSEPLQAWGMAHRRKIAVEANESFWVAPMEYVVLKKLEYYREGQSEKHLLDIRGMMAVSGEQIDQGFLNEQLNKLGLVSEWAKARKS
jgi:hypothetical protein